MQACRQRSALIRIRTLAVGSVAALALAGCGASSIAGDELADQVNTQLTEQVGQEPDEVECPEDLDAEVGATTQCTLTAGDESYNVDVEVTEVDGDTANFSIEVGEEPIS